MPAVKRHPQAVSRELIGIGKLVEVGVLDHEWAGRRFVHESTCGIQGVNDGITGRPSSTRMRPISRDCRHQIINVLQGHEGEHEVAALVGQRQLSCTRAAIVAVWVRFSSSINHCLGDVYSDDLVSDGLQITRQPALTTANVYREFAGRRQQREELVSVKPPIAIVVWCAGPLDPVSSFFLPRITERHGAWIICAGNQSASR